MRNIPPADKFEKAIAKVEQGAEAYTRFLILHNHKSTQELLMNTSKKNPSSPSATSRLVHTSTSTDSAFQRVEGTRTIHASLVV
jgi:hypothetical protein